MTGQSVKNNRMEMVNDWEIQIDWFLTWFDRHIGSFQNGMCLWDIVDKKVIEGMIPVGVEAEKNGKVAIIP